MQLRIIAGSLAIVAANTHKDAEELAPISIENGFLVFDFGADSTIETAIESIRTMDKYLGGLIADADDDADISALSQLKSQVANIERDAVREYAYKTRASVTAEATDANAESQLQGEQHASINDSSSSNGAANDEEEVVNYGTPDESEQQQQPRPRKRGR
jgi:hypothetical protein